MTTITEVAPDLFRLSIYVPDFDMQFNHFLVRDEEPLLFHAMCRSLTGSISEATAFRKAGDTWPSLSPAWNSSGSSSRMEMIKLHVEVRNVDPEPQQVRGDFSDGSHDTI